MQRQRVITLAPAIADTRPLLNDQRVNPKLIEPGGDRQARLGPADHKNRRFVVFVSGGFAPDIFPVVAAEITRISRAGWSVVADLLSETRQFLQCRRDEPRLHCAIVVGQANDAGAPADRRGELEDRLDAVPAEASDMSGWFAIRR